MRTEEKTNVKNSIGRLVFVILSLLVQVGWIAVLFVKLNEYSVFLNLLFTVFAFVLMLYIYGKPSTSAFKMPWIVLILVLPILGVLLYLLFGHREATRGMRRRFEKISPGMLEQLEDDGADFQALCQEDLGIANVFRYVRDYGKYPVYRNVDVRFYGEASDGFEAQLEELAKAEHFIFMEYHAIQEQQAFARLKDVLAERASKGVEVRVLYDDVGSVGFIDPGFVKRMEAVGVKCRIFNPVVPILNIFMNNRDHRKITVIDGKVGFTGGYNLADEYFNITHPYGYWKDTGIRLEGRAVKSLTELFLEMWNVMENSDEDVSRYFPDADLDRQVPGYVQPYGDSPLDGEPLGESVYMNLISAARETLYVATPYLIISDEMTRTLCLAAQRGVDVRLITPGIPDKKLVYKITRSYYSALVRRGVRVFEYTPGFLHEKQVICDGRAAVVGTINFDYRSLYHHFENGVLLYDCPAVADVAEDFQRTFAVSREVTEEYRVGSRSRLKFSQCLLRLVAPLL